MLLFKGSFNNVQVSDRDSGWTLQAKDLQVAIIVKRQYEVTSIANKKVRVFCCDLFVLIDHTDVSCRYSSTFERCEVAYEPRLARLLAFGAEAFQILANGEMVKDGLAFACRMPMRTGGLPQSLCA